MQALGRRNERVKRVPICTGLRHYVANGQSRRWTHRITLGVVAPYSRRKYPGPSRLFTYACVLLHNGLPNSAVMYCDPHSRSATTFSLDLTCTAELTASDRHYAVQSWNSKQNVERVNQRGFTQPISLTEHQLRTRPSMRHPHKSSQTREEQPYETP